MSLSSIKASSNSGSMIRSPSSPTNKKKRKLSSKSDMVTSTPSRKVQVSSNESKENVSSFEGNSNHERSKSLSKHKETNSQVILDKFLVNLPSSQSSSSSQNKKIAAKQQSSIDQTPSIDEQQTITNNEDESFDSTLTLLKSLPHQPTTKKTNSSPLKTAPVIHNNQSTSELNETVNNETIENLKRISESPFTFNNSLLSCPNEVDEIMKNESILDYAKENNFDLNLNFIEFYQKNQKKLNFENNVLINKLFINRLIFFKKFQILNKLIGDYSNKLIDVDQQFNDKVNYLKSVNEILKNL